MSKIEESIQALTDAYGKTVDIAKEAEGNAALAQVKGLAKIEAAREIWQVIKPLVEKSCKKACGEPKKTVTKKKGDK